MKAILSVFMILGAWNASGKGVELYLSGSSSPKDIITTLSPDTSSLHLVFKNKSKETYHVLKPVNFAGFSCYHLKIKNKDGVTRSLHPQMVGPETSGSAPEPLAIEPGKVGVIEIFLKPQAHARNWNYVHTWGFTGFQTGETELIISYTLIRESELGWLSRYRLKNGKAKLDISSKPILIGSPQDTAQQVKQEDADQSTAAPEPKPKGKENPESERLPR